VPGAELQHLGVRHHRRTQLAELLLHPVVHDLNLQW
jgi:hypothetical protein